MDFEYDFGIADEEARPGVFQRIIRMVGAAAAARVRDAYIRWERYMHPGQGIVLGDPDLPPWEEYPYPGDDADKPDFDPWFQDYLETYEQYLLELELLRAQMGPNPVVPLPEMPPRPPVIDVEEVEDPDEEAIPIGPGGPMGGRHYYRRVIPVVRGANVLHRTRPVTLL